MFIIMLVVVVVWVAVVVVGVIIDVMLAYGGQGVDPLRSKQPRALHDSLADETRGGCGAQRAMADANSSAHLKLRNARSWR